MKCEWKSWKVSELHDYVLSYLVVMEVLEKFGLLPDFTAFAMPVQSSNCWKLLPEKNLLAMPYSSRVLNRLATIPKDLWRFRGKSQTLDYLQGTLLYIFGRVSEFFFKSHPNLSESLRGLKRSFGDLWFLTRVIVSQFQSGIAMLIEILIAIG